MPALARGDAAASDGPSMGARIEFVRLRVELAESVDSRGVCARPWPSTLLRAEMGDAMLQGDAKGATKDARMQGCEEAKKRGCKEAKMHMERSLEPLC